MNLLDPEKPTMLSVMQKKQRALEFQKNERFQRFYLYYGKKIKG